MFKNRGSKEKQVKIANKVSTRKVQDVHEVARKYRDKLIKNTTKYEKIFKYIIDTMSVVYNFQHIVFVNARKFYIVDFHLPKYKLIIEIDGVHHYSKDGRTKDKERTVHLKKLGYKVIRFKNEEMFDPDTVEKYLHKLLKLD